MEFWDDALRIVSFPDR